MTIVSVSSVIVIFLLEQQTLLRFGSRFHFQKLCSFITLNNYNIYLLKLGIGSAKMHDRKTFLLLFNCPVIDAQRLNTDSTRTVILMLNNLVR